MPNLLRFLGFGAAPAVALDAPKSKSKSKSRFEEVPLATLAAVRGGDSNGGGAPVPPLDDAGIQIDGNGGNGGNGN